LSFPERRGKFIPAHLTLKCSTVLSGRQVAERLLH
jgi:hypothetical protein